MFEDYLSDIPEEQSAIQILSDFVNKSFDLIYLLRDNQYYPEVFSYSNSSYDARFLNSALEELNQNENRYRIIDELQNLTELDLIHSGLTINQIKFKMHEIALAEHFMIDEINSISAYESLISILSPRVKNKKAARYAKILFDLIASMSSSVASFLGASEALKEIVDFLKWLASYDYKSKRDAYSAGMRDQGPQPV